MQNRHHPLAPHQPFSKTALSLAPHQPFQSRTITIAFRRGASLLLPLHRILPFTQSSQKYNHPLLRTIALASLVKGRWIDGKAHTVALLLSACDMPTTFILQTFLPSRRRDCSAIFHPEQILPKPHYPSLRTTFLPPLSKGGGLTARHKLLLCCFLLAICPPFLYCKLFCRQDRGIASRCTEYCHSHNHLKSTTNPCSAPHSFIPCQR